MEWGILMIMHMGHGMVVMIKTHDNKVDGCSWFKAIRGRKKRCTVVWMLIYAYTHKCDGAVYDDKGLFINDVITFGGY